MRITGTAAAVTILRPPGVAVRVHLKGWAARLSIDDHGYVQVGRDVRFQSPGDERAVRRYDLEITGSVSDVTVTTSGRQREALAGSGPDVGAVRDRRQGGHLEDIVGKGAYTAEGHGERSRAVPASPAGGRATRLSICREIRAPHRAEPV